EHDRSDRWIQPRGIASAGEHADAPNRTHFTYPFRNRYSATSTPPLAAPMRVLCETRRYLTPDAPSTVSSRNRPTTVVMPPPASRSSRGWGRYGSSVTSINRAGDEGRPSATNERPNSTSAPFTSASEARFPKLANTASVRPSS